MHDNDFDSDVDSTDNELEGLDADEAAQTIHDDVRFVLDGANAYREGDAEYEAFREALSDDIADSVLAAHIPVTTSDEPFLHLSIHLLGETVVVEQRNVASTDTYRTYVGPEREVIPALAPVLEKEYVEVQYGGDAVDIMRDELDN